MAGATVYLLHVTRGHIVPWDIAGASGRAVVAAQDDAENRDRQVVQRAVDHLTAAGIEAHGEIVSATRHDVAEVILQRAKKLDVDLMVLGQEHHRGPGRGIRSSVAEGDSRASAVLDPAGPACAAGFGHVSAPEPIRREEAITVPPTDKHTFARVTPPREA